MNQAYEYWRIARLSPVTQGWLQLAQRRSLVRRRIVADAERPTGFDSILQEALVRYTDPGAEPAPERK